MYFPTRYRKNACWFALLVECHLYIYKNEIVDFFLNNNTCNFFYIFSSDSMSGFTLPVYVSEQNE